MPAQRLLNGLNPASRLKRFLGKLVVSQIARRENLRREVVDRLTKDFFHEFGVCFDFAGLNIPVAYRDGLISFREIFVEGEYAFVEPFLPNESFDWLDLGANSGFFSLWLTANRKQVLPGFQGRCLMVDPDPRSRLAFELVAKRNGELTNGFQFLSGAIGGTGRKNLLFEEREHLQSLVHDEDSQTDGMQGVRSVPVLSEAELLSRTDSRFRLVKVDVEGWEVDFIENYPTILERCDILIIEWHSWNTRGQDLPTFQRSIESLGFQVTRGREVNLDATRSCRNLLALRTR
ncbi:FkbM family methyltransferase [Verrucomicrobiota bacterium sgz303538]